MKNIIRMYNLTVKFLKFTLNIEIYEEFIKFLSKLIWRKILFYCKDVNPRKMVYSLLFLSWSPYSGKDNISSHFPSLSLSSGLSKQIVNFSKYPVPSTPQTPLPTWVHSNPCRTPGATLAQTRLPHSIINYTTTHSLTIQLTQIRESKKENKQQEIWRSKSKDLTFVMIGCFSGVQTYQKNILYKREREREKERERERVMGSASVCKNPS